jgi:Rap1a immunity proteins
MKSLIRTLQFAAILLLASLANAQQTNPQHARRSPIRFNHDGNWLQSTCGEYVKDNPSDAVKVGACVGYITGFVEGWDLNGFASDGLRLCFPNGVTNEQLVKIVYKYLNDHPEELHLDAGNLVLHILNDTFPCPSDKR